MSATSDFLEKVFKIQRMNEWRVSHPEQWQRFSDLVGSGTAASDKLNADQRKWVKFLQRTGPNPDDPFVREPPTAKKGFLKVQDYPAFGDLGDKEWEDLYNICRNAWYQMKHDTAAYAGYKNSVIQFIENNAHFFDDVAEDTMTAETTITEPAMVAMLTLLKRPEVANDASILMALGIGYGQKITSVNELEQKINDKKYNTDPEIRKAIMDIASKVINAADATKTALSRAANQIVAGPLTPEQKLQQYISTNNLTIIPDESRGWIPTINTAAQVNEFKQHYFDFFEEIYANEDVYAAFDTKEGGNKPITSAITKAKGDIDYDKTDSKNYIAPKHEKELTLAEQIQKWAGDTYSDYFKKYEELRGKKIFEHPNEVNDIIKQIDKAKIKTTDDLNKLVENADKIQKVLQVVNPKAAAAFGWLGDALKEFQGDPDMESTMKGALKSGRKMRNLVSELVMRAAADGKPETVENAKIALEVLAVIKYGNTTSKVMDAIKEDKDLFSIFGNEKLSWNKNEGVKFVTNAMDKTFRAACLGIGRGAAFVVNRFRRRNIKFNGRLTSNKMRKAYEDWNTKNTADKAAAQAAHDSDITAVVADQSEFKKAKDKAEKKQTDAIDDGAGHGLRNMFDHSGARYAGADDREVIRNVETDLSAFEADEYVAENKVQEYRELIDKLYTARSAYKRLTRLDYDEGSIAASAMTPEQKIARIQEIVRERNELKKNLKDQIGNDGVLDLTLIGGYMGKNVIDLMAEPRPVTGTWLKHARDYAETHPDYQVAQNDLSNLQNAIYTRQQHINNYRKAAKDLEAAETQIKAREKKINEWDEKHPDVYKQLMAYWDTLQDPSLTRFGPRRSSKIQESNSGLVAQLYRDKLVGYTVS